MKMASMPQNIAKAPNKLTPFGSRFLSLLALLVYTLIITRYTSDAINCISLRCDVSVQDISSISR